MTWRPLGLSARAGWKTPRAEVEADVTGSAHLPPAKTEPPTEVTTQ